MSSETAARAPKIAILGVFVADTAYRAARQPKMGETILGAGFALGPGGKGSNQAVAAGKVGGDVTIVTRLGDDAFGDLALKTWEAAGVRSAAIRDPASYTGAAYIFIDDASGDNAIIVCPGAAGGLSAEDVERAGDVIRGADVFMTQLEQPIPAARRALEIAREAGVKTVLNPAPAADLDDAFIRLCDWLTPNESEAEGLTGIAVASVEDAERAADALLARGAGGVVVTLGAAGALLKTADARAHAPAFQFGAVVETTGAGDAFAGGFSVALGRGDAPPDAVRYGCAVASLSVTRAGTAPSMPTAEEVAAALAAR